MPLIAHHAARREEGFPTTFADQPDVLAPDAAIFRTLRRVQASMFHTRDRQGHAKTARVEFTGWRIRLKGS